MGVLQPLFMTMGIFFFGGFFHKMTERTYVLVLVLVSPSIKKTTVLGHHSAMNTT